MKKIIFSGLILICSFLHLQAQIYTPVGTIQGTSGNSSVGIGTATPSAKLNIEGDHGSSRFLLHANGNGNPAPYHADLTLWASEPGLTWSGVGIGNNIHNFKTAAGGLTLLNTARGGSYIRLLDNSMLFNVVSSSGVDKQAVSIDGNGNIGIGTTTPTVKFDVVGDAKINGTLNVSGANALYFSNYGGGLFMQDDSWIRTFGGKNFYHNTGIMRSDGIFHVGPNGDRFVVNSNGNVGIGTTAPAYKLDVNGPVSLGGTIANHWVFGINAIGSGGSGVWFDYNNAVSNTALMQAETQGTAYRNIGINPYGGNVGIGTTTPDQKLTVNGIIHAKEIIVDTNITPDYVFQKYYTGKSNLKSDYVMPSLAEIESFTKKNHHLPNVPSAQEVQQNGVSLGTMSNVLLQKVEELTLYAIEQNKVIEELKAQVTALMAKSNN